MPASLRSIRRLLIVAIATLVQLSHNSPAAELSPKEKDLVQLVRSRIKANYASVTSIQANVKSVLVDKVFKPQPAAAANSKPKDEGGLTVTSSEGERRWTVTITGADERYEENSMFGDEPFRKTVIRRGDVQFEYVPPHYANLRAYTPEFLRSEGHYDPREAMLMSREDSISSLLADDRVQSAEVFTDGGKKRVRVVSKDFRGDYRIVLECPESANFLPAQVYCINDGDQAEYKGVVSQGAAIEYSSHVIDRQTVVFPKRIVSKYNGFKMSRDTAAYMNLDGGQTNTITIADLKLNERLGDDAFKAPVIPKGIRFYCFPEVELAKVPPELFDMAQESKRETDASAAKLKLLLKPVEDLVGQPAPPLPAEGWVGGKRPDLAGQPYLLHFWAVWCGPCKNDYQALRDMAADGVRIVGMHPAGTKPDEVAAFVKERKFGHPTFVSTVPDPNQHRMIAGYPAPLYPHYILVDAKGKVAAHGDLHEMRLKLAEMSLPEENAK